VLEDKLVTEATGKAPDTVAEEELPFVDIAEYSADLEARRKGEAEGLLSAPKPKVALVYAAGVIMQTEQAGGPSPGSLMSEGTAAAETLVPAIMDAAEDEAVTTILLRIDSPGGSPTASESILRALEKAKAKGKQIVVSMGPTAASGGYWIACKADRIFALPTTITGSIGVLGGKLDMSGLWAKLNVNWDAVRWGESSTIWSFNHSFNPTETEQVNAMLDDVYAAFLTRVSEGRKMELADVARLAKGRVWTGTAAFQNGLVDQLGGLPDALDFVAKEEGLNSREDLTVEVFPKPLTPLEKLAKLFGGQEEGMKALAAQSQILEWLAPVLNSATIARAPEKFGVYEGLQVH
jgi:protease-4